MVIITAGRWLIQYSAQWKKTFSQLRQNKFDLYSLGVGGNIDSTQLQDVASHPGHVFQAPSYDDLNKQYKKLVQVIVFGG